MCKFDKAPVNLSGDLNEIIYQANQEPNFGDQEGDQEIRQQEEDEVTDFWEDEDQEEIGEGPGEICAITGDRKDAGCWNCGKSGHIKSVCPLRRWSRLGRATGMSYRKEQGGRPARSGRRGDEAGDRSGAKPAYRRGQSGGYQGVKEPRKDF